MSSSSGVCCGLQGCFRHLSKIFKQLEEFRPFELLRSSRDRIHYLLVKEAKVIAMTCTHAALKRKDLVELAFKVSRIELGREKHSCLCVYVLLAYVLIHKVLLIYRAV